MKNFKPFISYSRNDTETANQIVDKLRSHGLEVWIDQKIRTGETWDQTVERNIKESDVLIVLMSGSSVQSQNVMDEVSYAIGLNKRILPVKIEDTEIPMRLARYQHIDMNALGIDKAMEKLVHDIGFQPESDTAETKPQAATQIQETKPEKKPSRKKVNTKMILVGIGIVAILVTLVLTDVIGIENAADDFDVNMVDMAASDEEAWANAESIGTYKSYLDYFSKYYDDGKYTQQASDRMDELANTTGIAQYSEGSGASKENYFHLYKAGSEITNTPEEGNYVITVIDSKVSVSTPEGQSTVTMTEDQVGVVRGVQVVEDKVYITINFHSK